MSMQQVPLPFAQEVDERGNIIEVKLPHWDHPSLYMWLRTHEPDLFREIIGEPHVFLEQPTANWPKHF